MFGRLFKSKDQKAAEAKAKAAEAAAAKEALRETARAAFDEVRRMSCERQESHTLSSATICAIICRT